MAVLYGTLPSGQLVPIEADSQGRLVANLAGIDQAVQGNLLVTGDVQMTSLNSGPLAGFRNQIINGQFSFWQRNTPVTLATNGYGPDRWAKVGGSSVTFTRSPLSFGQLGGCEVSGAAIQNSKILQPIEIGWGGATGPFTGQWTLSWYSDAQPTSASVEFALDSGSTNSVAWTADPGGIQSLGSDRYSLTFTASTPAANSEVVNVIFVPPTAATWTFSGVQFEPGPVATMLEHRPIGTELALCQRYYLRIREFDFFSYQVDVNSGPQIPVIFPTAMRAAPTMSPVTASNNVANSVASWLRVNQNKATLHVVSATNTGRVGLFSQDIIADAEL